MKLLKRHRLTDKKGSWQIVIPMTLVLVLVTYYVIPGLRPFNNVSPEIDLIWKLDKKKISRICMDQKVIFKIDSTNVMNPIKNEFSIGKHEITIYDEQGELIASDSVFLDIFERYDLLIVEKTNENNRTINISLTESILD